VSKITRVKITRNSWKPKNEQYRFQVVSRDFDKPAAFLAALGAGVAFSLQLGLETFLCHNLQYIGDFQTTSATKATHNFRFNSPQDKLVTLICVSCQAENVIIRI
jgi:hypothetical protein